MIFFKYIFEFAYEVNNILCSYTLNEYNLIVSHKNDRNNRTKHINLVRVYKPIETRRVFDIASFQRYSVYIYLCNHIELACVYWFNTI